MTDVWVTIGALAAGTIAIKALGPLAVGGRELPERVNDVIALLAPALLTALVLVETVGADDGYEIDARLGGVAAAAGCIALRLPIVVVVVVAAAAAAGLSALGV